MKCMFCAVEIADIDKVVLACNHTFHFRCLFRASRNNENCPLCNQILLEQKMEHTPIVRERLRIERGESKPCHQICTEVCTKILRNLDEDSLKVIGIVLVLFLATIMIDVEKKQNIEDAVKINDLAKIKKLLKRDFIYGSIENYTLCISAKYGQIAILTHLISIGIDLHANNDCAYKNAKDNLHETYAAFVKSNYR